MTSRGYGRTIAVPDAMRALSAITLAAAFALGAFSCGNPFDTVAGTGSVRLTIDTTFPKTAYPNGDPTWFDADKYVIGATGPGFCPPANVGSPGTVTISDLQPGTWTVTVTAWKGPVQVGSGTAPVTVTSGGVASVNVFVGFNTAGGDGSFVAGFSWIGAEPHELLDFQCTVFDAGNAIVIAPAGEVAAGMSGITLGAVALTPGRYRVEAKLVRTDSGDSYAVWGDSETVFIASGTATEKTWSLASANLNQPPPPPTSSIPMILPANKAFVIGGTNLSLYNTYPGCETRYCISTDGSDPGDPRISGTYYSGAFPLGSFMPSVAIQVSAASKNLWGWSDPVLFTFERLGTGAPQPLHVHASLGSDDNPGTSAAPLKTIQRAVDLAAAMQPALGVAKFTVNVARGTYETPPAGLFMCDGVSLNGGYNDGFTVQNPTDYETIILNSAPAGVGTPAAPVPSLYFAGSYNVGSEVMHATVNAPDGLEYSSAVNLIGVNCTGSTTFIGRSVLNAATNANKIAFGMYARYSGPFYVGLDAAGGGNEINGGNNAPDAIGLYAESSTMAVHYNTIKGNGSGAVSSVGVYSGSGDQSAYRNNIIFGGTAAQTICGVRADKSKAQFIDNNITGGNSGGAAYAYGVHASGTQAGFALEGNSSTAVVEAGSASTANQSIGIKLDEDAVLTATMLDVSGGNGINAFGLVIANVAPAFSNTIKNSAITGRTAGTGPGIGVLLDVAGPCTFDNTAIVGSSVDTDTAIGVRVSGSSGTLSGSGTSTVTGTTGVSSIRSVGMSIAGSATQIAGWKFIGSGKATGTGEAIGIHIASTHATDPTTLAIGGVGPAYAIEEIVGGNAQNGQSVGILVAPDSGAGDIRIHHNPNIRAGSSEIKSMGILVMNPALSAGKAVTLDHNAISGGAGGGQCFGVSLEGVPANGAFVDTNVIYGGDGTGSVRGLRVGAGGGTARYNTVIVSGGGSSGTKAALDLNGAASAEISCNIFVASSGSQGFGGTAVNALPGTMKYNAFYGKTAVFESSGSLDDAKFNATLNPGDPKIGNINLNKAGYDTLFAVGDVSKWPNTSTDFFSLMPSSAFRLGGSALAAIWSPGYTIDATELATDFTDVARTKPNDYSLGAYEKD